MTARPLRAGLRFRMGDVCGAIDALRSFARGAVEDADAGARFRVEVDSDRAVKQNVEDGGSLHGKGPFEESPGAFLCPGALV